MEEAMVWELESRLPSSFLPVTGCDLNIDQEVI